MVDATPFLPGLQLGFAEVSGARRYLGHAASRSANLNRRLVKGKAIIARFDGGRLSSEGELLGYFWPKQRHVISFDREPDL
jgi:hypothetical protein